MKRFWLLLCVLLLPLCAQAVVTLPEGVTAVEAEAFAHSGVDALVIPDSVLTVGRDVLAGCDASYLYLQSASTVLESGADHDVPFVFAPAGSSAASLPGFHAAESLTAVDGIYYAVTDAALPLCAKAPDTLSGSVTIPKFVGGAPVVSLDTLHLSNTGVTELVIPLYLTAPEGIDARRYSTMSVGKPAASVEETPLGRYVTWTAEVEGAYGAVEYFWCITVNDVLYAEITAEPTLVFAPMEEGVCTVDVTVTDALGDVAVSDPSEGLIVTEVRPDYRALLVGNTYPGETRPLAGCDNDVAAMAAMLRSMNGTEYKVSSAMNLSAGGIRSAIASAFEGAQPGDVSLFYYSGHGLTDGSLLGVGSTTLTVHSLRTALQAVPGKKIVILDCCYSGKTIGRSTDAQEAAAAAFNSAVISAFSAMPRAADNLADEGFIVLTACRGDQQSLTVADWANGYYFGAFTYSLCYGSGYDEWERRLLGNLPADQDGNGAITLAEAIGGVNARIAFLNSMMGGAVKQAVQYYGSGDFVLWRK